MSFKITALTPGNFVAATLKKVGAGVGPRHFPPIIDAQLTEIETEINSITGCLDNCYDADFGFGTAFDVCC